MIPFDFLGRYYLGYAKHSREYCISLC